MSNLTSSEEDSQNTLISRNRDNGFQDLTDREKAFAIEYISNGYKHKKAAQAVGLEDGLRQLRKPLVAAFLDYIREQNQVSAIVTREFVEQKYLEILPKLMGEEEVEIYDHKEGISVSAKKFHSAETVSVLRDLGKAAGYTPEDSGGSGAQVNVQINLGDLTGE